LKTASQISDFRELVTLTLTLDRVILHTVMHQSSTSTYQISLKSKKLFVDGRTDVRTGGRTFETHCIRSTRRGRPYNKHTYLFIKCWTAIILTVITAYNILL